MYCNLHESITSFIYLLDRANNTIVGKEKTGYCPKLLQFPDFVTNRPNIMFTSISTSNLQSETMNQNKTKSFKFR